MAGENEKSEKSVPVKPAETSARVPEAAEKAESAQGAEAEARSAEALKKLEQNREMRRREKSATAEAVAGVKAEVSGNGAQVEAGVKQELEQRGVTGVEVQAKEGKVEVQVQPPAVPVEYAAVPKSDGTTELVPQSSSAPTVALDLSAQNPDGAKTGTPLDGLGGIVAKIMAFVAPIIAWWGSIKKQFPWLSDEAEQPVAANGVAPVSAPGEVASAPVAPVAIPGTQNEAVPPVPAVAPPANAEVAPAVAVAAAVAAPSVLPTAQESQPSLERPNARMVLLQNEARSMAGNLEGWVAQKEVRGFAAGLAPSMIGMQVDMKFSEYFGEFQRYGITDHENIHTLKHAIKSLIFEHFLKTGNNQDVTKQYVEGDLKLKLQGALAKLDGIFKAAPAGLFASPVALLEQFSSFTGIGFVKDGRFQANWLGNFLKLQPESMNALVTKFNEYTKLQQATTAETAAPGAAPNAAPQA